MTELDHFKSYILRAIKATQWQEVYDTHGHKQICSGTPQEICEAVVEQIVGGGYKITLDGTKVL